VAYQMATPLYAWPILYRLLTKSGSFLLTALQRRHEPAWAMDTPNPGCFQYRISGAILHMMDLAGQ
jgi:hypothetical protein